MPSHVARRLMILLILGIWGGLFGMGWGRGSLPQAEAHPWGQGAAPLDPVGASGSQRAACPPQACTPGQAVDAYFWQAVLVYMGVPPRPFAVEALSRWQQTVQSAFCWNPLLTARRIPGWRCPSQGTTQHYADRFMGVRATAETLMLPQYASIQAMLRQEAFDHEGLRAALSAWFWGRPDACDDRCQDLVWQWHWLWQEHGISVLCPPLNCQYGSQVEPAFYAAVFRQLDLPVHPFAIKALQLWAEQEEAKACWNPLATVWNMGDQCCRYNAVGVKHYLSAEVGVYATARTLALPYYEPLRRFLAGEAWDEQGLPQAVALWVMGDPRGCAWPGYQNYCDRLLQRWQALWRRRETFTWADLGLPGEPTPWPTLAPTPTPTVTTTPSPLP